MSPPGSAFEQYCYYSALNTIPAAHLYLPAINKAKIASDKDNGGDYDDNKGGDDGRYPAGRGRSAGVGDMRRSALVIGCGYLYLIIRIASD